MFKNLIEECRQILREEMKLFRDELMRQRVKALYKRAKVVIEYMIETQGGGEHLASMVSLVLTTPEYIVTLAPRTPPSERPSPSAPPVTVN